MQVLRLREQSELEEAVQELISLASAQPPFPSKFASVSTRSLIETVSGDGSSVGVVRSGAGSRSNGSLSTANDLPTTTLMIQRRLNSEYRYLASKLRDEHEARIESERLKCGKKEDELREAHAAALKRIAAQQASQQDVIVPHVKPPSAVAVEVLERKLADQSHQAPSIGAEGDLAAQDVSGHQGGLDTVTRKVVTFWKAKYSTLLKQLEAVHAEIAAAEAKCSQSVDLRGASADTLEQLLMTIRDAEDRERSRADELRVEYMETCRRFGVQPQEPFVDGMGADVIYDAQTGRMIPREELERRNGVSGTNDLLLVDGNRSTGGCEFLRTLGREHSAKNRERQRTADQLEARNCKWYADFDEALDAFALHAGKISAGAQSQLVEEVIALLSESDTLDHQCYQSELALLKEEVDAAKQHREAVEKYEAERLNCLQNVLEAKEELRRLEIRLSCARQRETTSPSTIPSLSSVSALEDEAAVLSSKISLVENEIVVYQNERRELERVNATLDKRVQAVLLGQERQLSLQSTPKRQIGPAVGRKAE